MRTWVIGGGTPDGIGEAICWRLADSQADAIVATSADEADVRRSLTGWLMKNGPFDQVVYCAGLNVPEALGKLDMQTVADAYAVNVLGCLNVINELVARNEQGVNMVVVISDAYRIAMRGSIAYCSSKAALAHTVRCAARELAMYNWRVNGVAPGVVADTPMTRGIDRVVPGLRGWTAEQALLVERSMIPMERRCTKAEVAELVAQVLAAPAYVNGSIIDITGGK